jgi:hypothetical protein
VQSSVSFAFRVFLAPVAVVSAVCLVGYFLLPQPELRHIGTVYKPDRLLLASCAAGVVPWLLCAFFARPIFWLFHIGLLVGLASGALFWLVVYCSCDFIPS